MKTNQVEFEILMGSAAIQLSNTLASLRLEVFKKFPHLYVSDLEYEKKLQGYLTDPKAIIATIKTDGKIVGIASGVPLSNASEACMHASEIFKKHGLDHNNYYYLSDAAVLSEYRSKGFFNQLYPQIEEKIASLGYKNICFLSIIDKENHPLKPNDYRSLDSVWKKLGYKMTDMKVDYHWPTIQFDGSIKNEKHTLVFWIKDLKS